MRKAAFHTLGCKVNAYETELMQRALKEAGYEITSFDAPADVYVINTCSVTNIADKKSRQMIHRARTLNPAAVVTAAGCYVQGAWEQLKEDAAVDVLLGNSEKKDIARILEEYFRSRGENGAETCGTEDRCAQDCDAGGQQDKLVFNSQERARIETPRAPLTAVGDIGAVRHYGDPGAETMENHTRAVVKIQDGCNQFCSYCIIPYVRGRVRSRRFPEIREEAERLVQKGFRELVLTGIHLSSYGRDLPEEEDVRSLIEVLEELDRVPGIGRIRTGSLEPGIVTEEFVRRAAALKHLCPHFHLSLQSGSATVLKRMNRHYTPEEYLAGARRLREAFPDCALTTDVIVGFPGETEEEFQETLQFVGTVDFYEVHVFPFSPRKGTKAAAMPGQLTRQEKAERASRLASLQAEHARRFRERLLKQEIEILTEEEEEIGGQRWFTGCTRNYVRAAVPAEGLSENQLVKCRPEGFLTEELLKAERVF